MSAAEVALEVGVPEAMPTRRTTDPERVRGGRSREADADADEDVRDRDLPVRRVLVPEDSIPTKARTRNTYPARRGAATRARPRAWPSGRDQDHRERAGRIAAPASTVV